MRRSICEAIGTFALVFMGCGAVVVNGQTEGVVTHPGVALVFGLVVMAMIYAVGDVSGAHLNPAVTLGFIAAKRFPLRDAPAYISAQLVGAVAAGGVLKILFPTHQTLGATLPAGTVWQSFVLEVVLTAVLMFVILCVSSGAKERGITAGMAIGAVVALEALFGGPISGASMNPARSIGPALLSGTLDHLWVYLAAPVVGALIAVPCCICSRPGTVCCSGDAPCDVAPDAS